MKKTHQTFLIRAVNIASMPTLQSKESILAALEGNRQPNTPVHNLIRTIISDPRFFKVLHETFIWKKYAVAMVRSFIDSLTDEEWKDKKVLKAKVDKFLNEWFSRHVIPEADSMIVKELQGLTGISDDEIKRLIKAEKNEGIMSDLGNYDEVLGESIFDCTNGHTPEDEFKDFMDLEEEESPLKLKSVGREEGEEKYEKPEPLEFYDKELMRLAKMIGRGGGEESGYKRGKFLHASKSDIAGVTIGNDIGAALPTEVALLGSRQTENIFYDRYVKNRLQVFGSASLIKAKSPKKVGPIFLCVDTSGSMSGEPEQMAKSLSWAVAEIAQKDKRPVCLVNYSWSVSFFMLTDIKIQRKNLLKFLSLSYGGGNNEDMLFSFIFEKLPKSRYSRAMNGSLDGADLLVISDFQWMGLNDETVEIITKEREKGMRFYSLGIGSAQHFRTSLQILDENKNDGYHDGHKFYAESDFKFAYSKGKCTEIKDEIRKRNPKGKGG